MQYARIVSLIDAELERLTKVRQLLNYSLAPLKAAQNKTLRTSVSEEAAKLLAMAIAEPVKEPKATRQKRAAKAVPQLTLGLEPEPVQESFSVAGSAHPSEVMQPAAPSATHLVTAADAPAPSAISQPEPQLIRRIRRGVRGLRPSTPKAAAKSPAKAPAEATATALGGMVPAGPVFVPAEQIRLAQAQREQAQATEQKAEDRAAAAPLTAEMLAQKWLLRPTW